jgi:hypothetical protein
MQLVSTKSNHPFGVSGSLNEPARNDMLFRFVFGRLSAKHAFLLHMTIVSHNSLKPMQSLLVRAKAMFLSTHPDWEITDVPMGKVLAWAGRMSREIFAN